MTGARVCQSKQHVSFFAVFVAVSVALPVESARRCLATSRCTGRPNGGGSSRIRLKGRGSGNETNNGGSTSPRVRFSETHLSGGSGTVLCRLERVLNRGASASPERFINAVFHPELNALCISGCVVDDGRCCLLKMGVAWDTCIIANQPAFLSQYPFKEETVYSILLNDRLVERLPVDLTL